MARGKGGYGVRAIISSITGQFIDNSIYTFLAFAPIFGHSFELSIAVCFKSVVIGTMFEVLLESFTVPLTAYIVGKYKNKKSV